MYRFFVKQTDIDIEEGVIRITGEDVNHIRNALRMKTGEQILVSSGLQDDPVEYLCELTHINSENVSARIIDFQKNARELPSDIYLFQAIPKGDRFETVIEKTVELGVHEIIPVETARTIVRLDEKRAQKKTERWNALSLAAAKQSKRSFVPEVCTPASWKEALDKAASLDRIIVPYENADDSMLHTRDVFRTAAKDKNVRTIGIFIGPEGGFEESEIASLRNIGAEVITLGHRILRTDTAAIFSLSGLSLFLES